MITAMIESLTKDTWIEVSTTEDCTLYSIKAMIPNTAFKMKKASSDTDYWTVENNETGKHAQITVSNTNGYTGTLFYLSADIDPLDVQIFLG